MCWGGGGTGGFSYSPNGQSRSWYLFDVWFVVLECHSREAHGGQRTPIPSKMEGQGSFSTRFSFLFLLKLPFCSSPSWWRDGMH